MSHLRQRLVLQGVHKEELLSHRDHQNDVKVAGATVKLGRYAALHLEIGECSHLLLESGQIYLILDV